MKILLKKYFSILFVIALCIVGFAQLYSAAPATAGQPAAVPALRMALAPAANSHTVGNPTNANGPFKDLHNPSVFINESDTYINKGAAPVTVQIDTFNFYAAKNGNPVTPIVVKVNGDNDFTVLAIGATRSGYGTGSKSFDFDTTTPLITLNPGEKIATGFLDSNADGSGWGTGGNPIPASGNGQIKNGAATDQIDLSHDEVWALSPSTLIEAGDGFQAGVDTPAVVEGQNILITNQGKDLKQYNLLRSYYFSIEFSSDVIFKGATLYANDNFGGGSAVFSDGIYELAGTAVGANSASSIKVEDGYVAYLCDGTLLNPVECKLFSADDHSSLGSINNKADLIKIDQNDPARHGVWGDVVNMSQRAIATAQMPDGTVLFWEGGGNAGTTFAKNKAIMRIDPVTLQVTNSGQPGNHDTFCPGPALMPDGSLILAGGGAGTEDASSVFDWGSESWNRETNMDGGHYYGTSVMLADGSVLHALGSSIAANNHQNQQNNPEIWNGVSWSTLTGLDLTPLHADNGYYNSNWYPYLHVMPNSNLFHSGGVPTMHEINPSSQELFNQGTRAGNDGYRHWGNAIMIDEGLLFVSGGRPDASESVRTTVLIDLNDELNISSNYAAPMLYDRAFHNAVQLPTGDVFVSGGNNNGKIFTDYGTVYPAELWDRDSNSWSEMAEITVPRNYHSTSFLLPDGRIWQAGGDCNHCPSWKHHKNLQFYSPPYLFNPDGSLATRPEITTFPTGTDGIKASQTFTVAVQFDGNPATDIADFNIIKLSSTTHQINTDVRRLSLDYTHLGNGVYEIEAHDNINVMTPGYWMLFAVNGAGVPAEAPIVHVSTQPGTVNPTPKPKPLKVSIGNAPTSLQGADGWNSNLVINESDTYVNTTGASLTLRLDQFSFYAGKSGGPVTPFVVKVNGDDDFTIKAIGTPRIPASTGAKQFPFADSQQTITLLPNEKIAIGFLDALPDGTTSGTETAIVARNTSGGSDEIFYAGKSSGKAAELVVGQAPILIASVRDVGLRDYAFAVSMVEFDPTQATATPTATSTALPTATETSTPANTPTAVPTASATATPDPSATVTPIPTNTAVPTVTSTPDPSATTTPIPTSTSPAATPSVTPIVTGTLTQTPAPSATPGPQQAQIYLPMISNR